MERRLREEITEPEGHPNSGVFRAVAPQLIAKLTREVRIAALRVSDLRSDIAKRRGPTEDTALDMRALHEIDAAHEELRVAEEELHAQADEILATRAILDRERRVFGELFQAAPEAYLVTDDRGSIIQANRRAATLFNIDSTFLVGKPLVSLIARDDRSTFFNLLEAVSDAIFRTELRIQPRKEHEPVWISLSAQRGVRDESSICIRWLMRNITREKEEQERLEAIEAQLRSRIRELEAASLGTLASSEHEAAQLAVRDREHRQVLAEVAHELRNPLGSIAGWLHMVGDGEVDVATLKRALASMTRSVRGLARVLDDLIEHARVENCQVTLKTAPINLLRVAIDVIEDMRPLAKIKQIRLELSAKAPRIDVQADAVRLQQVFRNLIGNAIKFTPEQGSVTVTVSASGLRAEVAVTDTGRGIPREALSKIFAPFMQLGEPGARHAGLGLGLSIARKLVELHGGTISAESEGRHCGSTFRVRLPLFALN